MANPTDADLEPVYPCIFTHSEENTGTSENRIGAFRTHPSKGSSGGSVRTDEAMSPPLQGITSQIESVNDLGAPSLKIEF